MRPIYLAIALIFFVPGIGGAAEPPQFADAPLRAVFFVDEHEGWAAGDDGVVLHTIDGGQTWERQPTGLRASLRSIWFVDAFTGFAVGRESLSHGTGSSGVILFTEDGGVKWQRVSFREMPGLHKIQFVSKKTAVLVGDATDRYPTGIFVSQDAGATWKPLPGPRCPGWLSADFDEGLSGTLVGPWGTIGHVFKGEVQQEIKAENLNGAAVRGVRRLDGKKLVVGDRGMIRIRTPEGTTKAPPRFEQVDLGISPELAKCIDFHGVYFVGERGWAVGRPGTQVLHTWDGGKSWQAQSTGQNLPLDAVHFVDAKRGWVVGELGTILHTDDGGKTWKLQRRGGQRAAVLVVTCRGESLPAGLLAATGADEGYLAAAIRFSCADPKSASVGRAMDEARFAEAVRSAGGAAGEMLGLFPFPQHMEKATAAELAKFWGQTADEARGIEELQRHLVLAIRIWQPDVIVTDCPDPLAESGQSGALVALVLTKAFELAGKADVYPEQITKLGLEAWTPKSLYGRWEKPEGAHVSVDLGKPLPNLRASPKRFVSHCLGLLHDEPAESPTLAHFRLLATSVAGAESHKHPFQGIKLAHGGQARRAMHDAILDADLKAIQLVENQQRDIQEVARKALTDSREGKAMLANVQRSLAGLDDERAGEAAFAIGNLYARSGQWSMAKEVFLMMVDQYPAHRLASEACRWLIRHGSSSEARRREELNQFWVSGTYRFEAVPNPKKPDDPIRISDTNWLKRDLTKTLYRKADDLRKWHKSSLAMAEHLSSFGPLFSNDPEFQFPVQASKRALGDVDAAQLWFTQFRLNQTAGPWLDAAATELWLHNRKGPPPKPIAFAVHALEPPYLDGKLDDPCWKEARGLIFKDAVAESAAENPTECWFAYDVNFLYVAIRCKHPAGRSADPVKPRKRDDDLSRHDRVSIMLDLDRDYATYYRFEVDQRGCVAEDCWGDKSWDPKWYVAVHSDETSWQIEAAVPLHELTGDKVGAHAVWACNVVRTIPSHGVQAFSTPADVQPRPEGMGLLTFIRAERPGAVPVNPAPRMPVMKE